MPVALGYLAHGYLAHDQKNFSRERAKTHMGGRGGPPPLAYPTAACRERASKQAARLPLRSACLRHGQRHGLQEDIELGK